MHHHIMARTWWLLAGRGVAGLLLGATAFWSIHRLEKVPQDLFGMALFVRPISVVASLVLLLGAYAILDGIFTLLMGLQDFGGGKRWMPLVLEGAASVLLGLFTWFFPGNTVLVALYAVAAWAFITGVLEIGQGLELNEYRDRRPFFIGAGVCSLLFGLSVLSFRLGGLALVWAIGTYALIFGGILLAAGARLRGYAKGAGVP